MPNATSLSVKDAAGNNQTVSSLDNLIGAAGSPSANALTVQRANVQSSATLNSATSNAAVTVSVNGSGTVGITLTNLTGTGATLTLEASDDGGTTWSTATGLASSTGILNSTFTTDQQLRVNVAGRTNVRLRVSATGTGNVTVASNVSDSNGLVGISTPLPPGSNQIGNVGSSVATPSANFTRPANTTAYASGQLVANSTTAGSVVALSWTAARVTAGTFHLRRVRLRKSSTTVGGAFRIHLYTAAPTFSNGDGGAWLTTGGQTTYLGAFDVTVDKAFSDGAFGVGVPQVGAEITVALAAGQTIYGCIEARSAYTPTSGEVFTVELEDFQN